MKIDNTAYIIKPGMEKAFFDAMKGRGTKEYWEECFKAGKNIPKEQKRKIKEMF